MRIIIDKTGDTYGERELLLYWIYWLRKIDPNIETNSDHQFHKRYLKLRDYYQLHYEIIRDNPDKYWLFKSRLAISEKFYGKDYREHLHEMKADEFKNPSNPLEINDILKIYMDYEEGVIKVPDWYEYLKEIERLPWKVRPDPIDKPITKLIESIYSNSEVAPNKLSSADAVSLLNRMQDKDYKLNKSDEELIRHKSFRAYRSKFIRPYKEVGFPIAFQHLSSGKNLTLLEFYRMCEIPAHHFEKWIVESFKYACNNKKGTLYNDCKGWKLSKKTSAAEDHKTEKILIFEKIA